MRMFYTEPYCKRRLEREGEKEKERESARESESEQERVRERASESESGLADVLWGSLPQFLFFYLAERCGSGGLGC